MKFNYFHYFVCIAFALLSSAEKYIVETDTGNIHGYVKHNVVNWDDIPYAQPPHGDLRWKGSKAIGYRI